MTPQEEEIAIEMCAAAHREHGPEGVGSSPAWHDLDEAGRARAFEVARRMRRIEASLDPRGLSATARAVLRRIRT